jgi:hypothetical protein
MADDKFSIPEWAVAEMEADEAAKSADSSVQGYDAIVRMRRLDFLPILLAAHRVLSDRLGAPAAQERIKEHLDLKNTESARVRVAQAAEAMDREAKSLGSLGFALRATSDYWATAFVRLSDAEILTWVPTEVRPLPFSALEAAALFDAVNRGSAHPCPTSY